MTERLWGLREALNRLAANQLVVISPNRGASVAPLTLTDFPAFIEALALAQSAVNAFAAMRRSSEDLAAIATAARNPHLATFYNRLLDQSARLARVSFSYESDGCGEHLDEVVTEHRALVEAISASDAPRAEMLGHDHAALFQRRMLTYLTVNAASTLSPIAGPIA